MTQSSLIFSGALRWDHQVGGPTVQPTSAPARLGLVWNGFTLKVALDDVCGKADAEYETLMHRNKIIAAQKVNCYHPPIDVSSGQCDGADLNRVRK